MLLNSTSCRFDISPLVFDRLLQMFTCTDVASFHKSQELIFLSHQVLKLITKRDYTDLKIKYCIYR